MILREFPAVVELVVFVIIFPRLPVGNENISAHINNSQSKSMPKKIGGEPCASSFSSNIPNPRSSAQQAKMWFRNICMSSVGGNLRVSNCTLSHQLGLNVRTLGRNRSMRKITSRRVSAKMFCLDQSCDCEPKKVL